LMLIVICGLPSTPFIFILSSFSNSRIFIKFIYDPL
jgi:hypothetical protein